MWNGVGEPSAVNFHHSEKEIEGQSSSNSFWTPRMRGEAEANAESTEKPVVRLTPAPKYNEDPSMEFEQLRNEEKDGEPHHPERVLTIWELHWQVG